MKYFYIIGFLILMSFDTLTQISFKFASIHAMPMSFDLDWLQRVFSHPWIYGAFIGYIGAFFTWMSLLKHAPIGPAFAASHLELVTVTLLSIWLFNEPLTFAKVIGAGFILFGVILLAKEETEADIMVVKSPLP
ncbi:multidrug transporter EmrE-like cation transporter [Acinetobacter calcoaceticus]|uniref:Multidrug transporter EmrE-like cation transporter n=1 Tax=Acinetobacter calcoaceticus TaxID=471 RepID=A0A4R1XZW7_ACICA|nr:multidrug transporter EmrE-like cation transporter [Acinetobacter calcoaceticus]